MADSDVATLLFLPHGREADLMHRLLKTHGIDSHICRTVDELLLRVSHGSGPIVLAERSLDQEAWDKLVHSLESQPTWSDVPVLICEWKRERTEHRPNLRRWRGVTMLPRPLHIPSFCALIRSATEARRQQYSLRDMLQRLERLNANLEQRSVLLQRLTLELTAAEQKERRRIANDIHDHLAQLLVLSRMKLRQTLRTFPSDAAVALLKDTDRLLEESLSYSRSLVAELSPQVLGQAGLPAALRWLGEQMQTHGLHVDMVLTVEQLAMSEQRAALVYQSVRELLFNIIKHAGVDHATVTVHIDGDSNLHISVVDAGQGFDPSSALQAGVSTKYGLLTIRERIEALQGTFHITSRIGGGTHVTLCVPIDPPKGVTVPALKTAAIPSQDRTASSRSIHLLLVDDHMMMRQGLRTLLEAYPNVTIVGEAADGKEAVRHAMELRPDVVVMDVNMPRLNGVQATTEILKVLPRTKIIALSYDMSTSDAMRQAGAVQCINKADAVEQLYEVICQATGLTESMQLK